MSLSNVHHSNPLKSDTRAHAFASPPLDMMKQKRVRRFGCRRISARSDALVCGERERVVAIASAPGRRTFPRNTLSHKHNNTTAQSERDTWASFTALVKIDVASQMKYCGRFNASISDMGAPLGGDTCVCASMTAKNHSRKLDTRCPAHCAHVDGCECTKDAGAHLGDLALGELVIPASATRGDTAAGGSIMVGYRYSKQCVVQRNEAIKIERARKMACPPSYKKYKF